MGAVVDSTDVLRQLVGNHGGEFFFISVPDRLFIVPAFEFQHIQSAVHPRDLLHMRLLRFKQFLALRICDGTLFTPIHELFDMEMLQLDEAEYNLIKFPQRGVCLYKCGNERYLLAVHAPAYKEKLFGTAGGR